MWETWAMEVQRWSERRLWSISWLELVLESSQKNLTGCAPTNTHTYMHPYRPASSRHTYEVRASRLCWLSLLGGSKTLTPLILSIHLFIRPIAVYQTIFPDVCQADRLSFCQIKMCAWILVKNLNVQMLLSPASDFWSSSSMKRGNVALIPEF